MSVLSNAFKDFWEAKLANLDFSQQQEEHLSVEQQDGQHGQDGQSRQHPQQIKSFHSQGIQPFLPVPPSEPPLTLPHNHLHPRPPPVPPPAPTTSTHTHTHTAAALPTLSTTNRSLFAKKVSTAIKY
jgi:hypothetical protein